MVVSKLSSDDIDLFIELIQLFEEVFEMKNFKMPDKSHLQRLLNKEDFKVIVAQADDGQVIGGLTLYILHQYYARQPLGYIFDLAVRTSFQRKGVGQQLINFTRAFCKKEGLEEVFVQADKEDGYALDFYRKTTPTDEEEALHFSYRLRDR